MATSNGPWQNKARIEWVYTVGAVSQGTTSVRVTATAYLRMDGSSSINGTWAWGHSGAWGTGSGSRYLNLGPNGRGQLSGTGDINVALTDSAQTRSFTVWVDHWFGRTQSTLGVSVPARYARTPSGLSVSRTNDSQHVLTWSRNSTYTSVVVQRRTNDGSWTQIARPSGNAFTFTDTTTQANRKYAYRVAGVGGSGQSGWSNTVTVYTTPAAPSSVSATRVGDDIRVAAAGLPPYATSYDVEDDGTVVATSVSLPWTHVAPNPALTHKYRIRAKRGSLTSGWSSWSNTVQLQAAPNAPVDLKPSGTAFPPGENFQLSWKHNPVDSSEQTQYELEVDYGTFVVPLAGGSDEFRNYEGVSASTVPRQWRVRTKGAHPDWSPWSAWSAFYIYDRPDVAVTIPDGDVDHPELSVGWSYVQGQSRPQSAWRVELYGPDGLLEKREGAGAQTSLDLNTRVVNGVSYEVRVWGATGEIWSEPAVAFFDAVFVPPAYPIVDGSWDDMEGAVTVSVLPGDPEPGTPDVVNLFTNPRLVGDGTWAEVARFTTGDEPPEMVQPEDFRIRDLGTGESVMEIEQVAGFTRNQAIAGRSTKHGKPAVRVIATSTTDPFSTVQIPIPAAARGQGTLIGTAHIDAPLAGSVGTTMNANRLRLRGELPTQYGSESPPNEAGSYPQRVVFSDLTGGYQGRFINGSLRGSGDVWWTDIGLFAGDYQGPAFSGGDGLVLIDGTWRATAWAGVEDDSYSVASVPPATVAVTIERSVDDGATWEPVLHGDPQQTTVDPEALSYGVTLYRVTSHTAAGAASVLEYPVLAESESVWWSGGPGFTQSARLPYNPEYSVDAGRERSARRYSGRSKPVAYSGGQLSRTVQLQGTLIGGDPDSAQVAQMIELAQAGEPVHMIRTPDGDRVYGVIGTVQLPRQTGLADRGSLWGYSLTLDETNRN